ncbi:MAG: hypothetical protein QXZ43_04645 [Candidatus Aenigmatarchaeota archaeon]
MKKENVLWVMLITIILFFFMVDLHETIHERINEYFNVRSERRFSFQNFVGVYPNEYDLSRLNGYEFTNLMTLHSLNEVMSYYTFPFLIIVVLLLLIYFKLSEVSEYYEKQTRSK